MAIDELIEHCLNRAGGSLRMASWFDGENSGVIYHREDVDTEALHRHISAIKDQLAVDGEPSPVPDSEPTGDVMANVQVREEEAILHLPTGQNQGIVLCFEVVAARDLYQFILECHTKIGEEHSISVEDKTGWSL